MNRLRSGLRLVLLALSFACILAGRASAELSATGLRISGNMQETHVEIEFNEEPQIQTSLLAGPHRLVLDLQQALFAFGSSAPPKGNLVASFRAGLMQEGRSRIILTLAGPFALRNSRTDISADGRHHVFSFSLIPSTEEVYRQALADQMLATASTAGGKGDRVVQGATDRDYTIVVDPGHGGIDSGATGMHGTAEKQVTLDFALQLAESLRSHNGLKVFLTRDKDQFISLDERVRIARQLNADLFVSVHADSIRDSRLRGATVYTLSDKASDEVAQAVAQNENLSDAIGGVDVPVEDHAVADILIDLTRRETMKYSVGFARQVIDAIGSKTKLINNSHRSAGFRVLKAPDIPSVLIELGYLSNEDDEKQIADAQWRKQIAAELAQAIKLQADQTLASRQ